MDAAYKGEADLAYQVRIVNGRNADTFALDFLITRQEVSAILARVCQKYGGTILEEDDSHRVFLDQDDIMGPTANCGTGDHERIQRRSKR